MSRLSNMPKMGWFFAGLVVAILVVPAAAGAKAMLKFSGIEGTSTNKADVTGANQLLTTEASASNIVQSNPVAYTPNSFGLGGPGSPIVTAPAGIPLIVDILHINVDTVPSAGLKIIVGNSGCTSALSTLAFDSPSTAGEHDVELTPGALLPAGDSLCLVSIAQVGAVEIWVSAYKDIPS